MATAKPKSGPIKQASPASKTASAKTRQKASRPRANPGTTEPAVRSTIDPKTVPSWEDWAERPTVTVLDAVCLAHNIRPTRNLRARLSREGDYRVEKFRNHLVTLKRRIGYDRQLKLERPLDGLPTNKTRLILKDFVAWVRMANPFPGLTLAAEFLRLESGPAAALVTATEARDSKVAKELSSATPIELTEDSNLVPGKAGSTAAHVLVALAIHHYGFRLDGGKVQPISTRKGEGVYSEIVQLCMALGFPTPVRTETVSDLLRNACKKIDGKYLADAIRLSEERKSGGAVTNPSPP